MPFIRGLDPEQFGLKGAHNGDFQQAPFFLITSPKRRMRRALPLARDAELWQRDLR